MTDSSSEITYIELTARIVSAYVGHNPVPSAEIANLISQVHTALRRVSSGQLAAPAEPLKPAVPVKRSINPEYLVSLNDERVVIRNFEGKVFEYPEADTTVPATPSKAAEEPALV